MAAPLRLLYAGKKLPYVTALKAVTKDTSHSTNHRAYFQHSCVPEDDSGKQLQARSLENYAPPKLRHNTIGYEDKRQAQDRPKPSHPGEYVTAWGDFQPRPLSKAKPPGSTQKPKGLTAASLPASRPDEWASIKSAICIHQQNGIIALVKQSGMHLSLVSPGTAALMLRRVDGHAKSVLMAELSLGLEGLLENAKAVGFALNVRWTGGRQCLKLWRRQLVGCCWHGRLATARRSRVCSVYRSVKWSGAILVPESRWRLTD